MVTISSRWVPAASRPAASMATGRPGAGDPTKRARSGCPTSDAGSACRAARRPHRRAWSVRSQWRLTQQVHEPRTARPGAPAIGEAKPWRVSSSPQGSYPAPMHRANTFERVGKDGSWPGSAAHQTCGQGLSARCVDTCAPRADHSGAALADARDRTSIDRPLPTSRRSDLCRPNRQLYPVQVQGVERIQPRGDLELARTLLLVPRTSTSEFHWRRPGIPRLVTIRALPFGRLSQNSKK